MPASREPGPAHRERGGGARVGQRQAPAGHGEAGQAGGRAAGPRVDDVRAALGGPRRGHGAVHSRHHQREAAGAERVGDADPPRQRRRVRPGVAYPGVAGPAAAGPLGGGRAGAHALHVAAAVDQVARRPGGGQNAGGPLDGPALHVAGRVEPAPRRGGEEAARQLAEERAGLDDLGHLRRAGVDGH